jgi:uncharacterized protein YndB with AHSA1/START domain
MSTNENPSDGVIARLQTEVNATPEQVWEAIATGTGNAGWLFPAEIEEREGGAMLIHRAPYGGDAPATVTAYDPPRRFAIEERMDMPGLPPWATEFLVEGRAGGTTIVRLVTGFHSGGEGWEPMVNGAAEGWAGAFEILRIYVQHFLGESAFRLGATGDTGRPLDDRSALSAELLGAIGLTGLQVGDKFRAPDDAPPLAGVVDAASEHGCLVRTEEPGPGIFEISTFSMNGETATVNVDGRIYGDDAEPIAQRDALRWHGWLTTRFPDLISDAVVTP